MVCNQEEGKRRERSPDSPVGQLVLLVSLHSTAVLEEEGQRVFGQLQHMTRHTGVKQVYHVESKVPL